jgi:hypothetical protein
MSGRSRNEKRRKKLIYHYYQGHEYTSDPVLKGVGNPL